MKKTKILAPLLFLTAITGCQSPTVPKVTTSTVRTPSSFTSTKSWEELRVLKQHNVELSALSIQYYKKKNFIKLKKIEEEQAALVKQISAAEEKIELLPEGSRESILTSSSEWREEKERIELRKLSLYEESKNVQFSVSTYEARQTDVVLSQTFFSSIGLKPEQGVNNPIINFIVKCDAPFEVKYGLVIKKINANTPYKFSLGDKKFSNDTRTIRFHTNLNTCNFKFTSSIDEKKTAYAFTVVNETKKLKPLEGLLKTTEICTLKKGSDKFFETSEFSNMNCPAKYETIKVLPQPEDSLHARAVALLGQDLPADFIKNGNPYGQLDFSKAPKFDAILVSYLVFRADFYGTLIGRLLAYHADQGALVRVIVSDVIALDKDEVMFEKLMAEHPNLKAIRYRFDSSEQGGAWISEFHRTNHVKLFAAYSKENPQDSFVIMGGRNIHDGFAFRTPVDVSKYPEVVNYNSGDESWAYWRDFEMVVHGQDFTESVVRNYMNFYHINKENLVMKLSSLAVQKDSATESPEEMMRYYVSIPFKDEPNLNLLYARMIDSAKKKILISSPYFRPVKEIADALHRAVDRGVDITIITRLDLKGDTADFILGAVNKEGVNQFLESIKVYEYTEPSVILHSKLLMVDDEFTFVSSVNLNKRSFYHDLENGVVVNDRKFTVEMGETYKGYLTLSRQLTEKQKIEFWKKWVIALLDKVF